MWKIWYECQNLHPVVYSSNHPDTSGYLEGSHLADRTWQLDVRLEHSSDSEDLVLDLGMRSCYKLSCAACVS